MSIIAWIVLGAIAGYLAGFFVSGDEGLGVIGHIVLGIVGALVGGFLASVLFNTKPIDGAFDISSIVAATIGAIIVVLVAGMVTRGTRIEFGLTPHGPVTPGSPVHPQLHETPTGNGGRFGVPGPGDRPIAPSPAAARHGDATRRAAPAGLPATPGPARCCESVPVPLGVRGPTIPSGGHTSIGNTRNVAAMPMLPRLSGLHQRRLYREPPQPHRIDNLDRQ